MAGLTKAQIAERKAAEEQELLQLRTRLAEAESRAEEAERRADWYEQADVGDSLPASPPLHAEAAEEPLLLPTISEDPFAAHNPHKFLKHPAGFHLGWKNPVYRESHRGWRGWRAVEFDDPIGRSLSLYLPEVPHKMSHALDNYVRRGDSVLCVLEEGIWNARQKERSDKAKRYLRTEAPEVTEDTLRKANALTGQYSGRTMTS